MAKKKVNGRTRMENNFWVTLAVAVVLTLALMIGFQVMSSNEKKNELPLQIDASLTVEDGDKVNIDFVSYIDGVEYDGATTGGAGADLVIGSETMKEMEEQLIGAHPGETLEIYITFPEDYSHNATLAGNEVLFVVTVNGIYR